MIKVVHLWKSDSAARGGGGAAAMYRLHCSLRKAGIDSKILCEIKTTTSPDVIRVGGQNKLESLIRRFTSLLGLNDIHRINSLGITRNRAYSEADIVNLHGTHGFISYFSLPYMTRMKPTKFVLHDMWALTGHCAVSYDCDRWQTGRGNCPYPEAPPPVRRDSTRLEWILKKWVYSRSKLVLVCPSKSLTEWTKLSMLRGFPIHHIPHGIDTRTYQPLDPGQCRLLLGLPKNKRILMIAATNLKDFHKGCDLLVKSLRGLPKSLKTETLLLTLGNNGDAIGKAAEIQTYNIGYVSNDRLKAIVYSSADLLVSSTRAEAFGLIIQESMACGTPVVSFGVGGVPDLVRPGITGYLAEPENADDLCNGILQLLSNNAQRHDMGQRCHEVVLREYSQELQAKRYIQLYERLLHRDLS